MIAVTAPRPSPSPTATRSTAGSTSSNWPSSTTPTTRAAPPTP
ncbi:hypothetical protein O1L60_22925 [Streptomyces diastatochromogenes]|nr:hypothetical protein [Streptomyces diastatochromogenes]